MYTDCVYYELNSRIKDSNVISSSFTGISVFSGFSYSTCQSFDCECHLDVNQPDVSLFCSCSRWSSLFSFHRNCKSFTSVLYLSFTLTLTDFRDTHLNANRRQVQEKEESLKKDSKVSFLRTKKGLFKHHSFPVSSM